MIPSEYKGEEIPSWLAPAAESIAIAKHGLNVRCHLSGLRIPAGKARAFQGYLFHKDVLAALSLKEPSALPEQIEELEQLEPAPNAKYVIALSQAQQELLPEGLRGNTGVPDQFTEDLLSLIESRREAPPTLSIADLTNNKCFARDSRTLDQILSPAVLLPSGQLYEVDSLYRQHLRDGVKVDPTVNQIELTRENTFYHPLQQTVLIALAAAQNPEIARNPYHFTLAPEKPATINLQAVLEDWQPKRKSVETRILTKVLKINEPEAPAAEQSNFKIGMAYLTAFGIVSGLLPIFDAFYQAIFQSLFGVDAATLSMLFTMITGFVVATYWRTSTEELWAEANVAMPPETRYGLTSILSFFFPMACLLLYLNVGLNYLLTFLGTNFLIMPPLMWVTLLPTAGAFVLIAFSNFKYLVNLENTPAELLNSMLAWCRDLIDPFNEHNEAKRPARVFLEALFIATVLTTVLVGLFGGACVILPSLLQIKFELDQASVIVLIIISLVKEMPWFLHGLSKTAKQFQLLFSTFQSSWGTEQAMHVAEVKQQRSYFGLQVLLTTMSFVAGFTTLGLGWFGAFCVAAFVYALSANLNPQVVSRLNLEADAPVILPAFVPFSAIPPDGSALVQQGDRPVSPVDQSPSPRAGAGYFSAAYEQPKYGQVGQQEGRYDALDQQDESWSVLPTV